MMTAFWMTWKPGHWPVEQLRDLVDRFNRDGTAEEPWRIAAHRQVKIGDQAFVFAQGKGPRGIFGVGTITTAPGLNPKSSPNPSKPQYYVTIHFTRLVDPTERMLLPLDHMSDAVPKSMIRIQASGCRLEPDVATALAIQLGLQELEGVETVDGPLPNSLPIMRYAIDSDEPPGKTKSTTYRFIRDTDMTRRLKKLHQFVCQLCGLIMVLPDGGRYAEAHHIRPLGGGHGGPDVPSNILCLCPNHHAELDYGMRCLDITTLNRVRGHAVNPEFIKYHNDIICKLNS